MLAIIGPAFDKLTSRIPGVSGRFATIDGYTVYTGTAAAIGGECEALTIRRKAWTRFYCWRTGDAADIAAVAIGDPDVAGVDKGDVIIADIGLPQQTGSLPIGSKTAHEQCAQQYKNALS